MHWGELPHRLPLLMQDVTKGICHHSASQIKFHSGKRWSNWIETATLVVWVKLISHCLIKSVVESSSVNPQRSIMATQQHYKQRPTHMFHHWESHWQCTASGNWWYAGSSAARQDVHSWAWQKLHTPLSSLSTNYTGSAALWCEWLWLAAIPHSRRSSFQQEEDQNNLARAPFHPDSHRRPLISPECYLYRCKPVII